jgi:Family of unknown function (DUF5641)
VTKYCTERSIEWKFAPPRSPHFGGLYEAAVKSAKTHLRKILHNVHFTFEEFATILTEIEAILNSRPLTPMSNDPSDLQPLTAAHFLTGASLKAINDHELPVGRIYEQWLKLKEIREQFWDRWRKEYLAELQCRKKWYKEMENIELGTMVILKENNLPSLHWKMGRIVEVFQDSHGMIRVVMVKTENGLLRRAIHELAPLPVKSDLISVLNDTNVKSKKWASKNCRPTSQKTQQSKNKANSKQRNAIVKKSKTATKQKTLANLESDTIVEKSRSGRIIKQPQRYNGLIVTMVLLFMFFNSSFGSQCEFKSVNNNQGLYFEEK